MAKANKPTNAEQVAAYLNALDNPMAEVVLALRTVILATDANVAELIKWNSLAFQYKGEMKPFDPKEYKRDIVVFNLHKKDHVLLVFPTGAQVANTSGLLEGKFTDGRKTAKFTSLAEVDERANDLQSVIREWLNLVV